MGKKNKYKNESGEKKPAQQQQTAPQQAGQGNPQPGPSGSQGQAQKPQQSPQQQKPSSQQGASGGQAKQQQQVQSQQGTAGQQQRGPVPQQQGGPGQQQGSWGGGGQGGQQQRGPVPQQQGGPGQQQGSWGGGGQGGQQQRGPGPQQQGGQGQQQGSWGGGGQGGQQQRGPGPQQQGGQGQQQGSWGGGGQGGQQQRGPGPQQQGGQGQQQGSWGGGGQGGQQQRGPGPQQQGGQGQQQGSWGGGGQGGQQQRGPGPQQQGGQGQQQGSWGGGGQGGQQQRGPGPQQQGSWVAGQQQRGPIPQQGGQQQRGPGPQQRGQQSVERSFQQLSLSDEQVLPVKAKSCSGLVRGTLGRPGSLEINYLKLDLKNMPNEAFHYDVTITPDRPKKFLRPAFDQCKREVFGGTEAAFDGNKSCYSVIRLPTPIEHTVQVPDSGNRTKEFKVEIKETDDCVVDLNSLRRYHNESVSDKPMRAIQVVDVVLSGNNHERGIRVGRSFFCKPKQPFDLQGGFEAWTGLFQAAILGEQPFINVDIAHKSFPRKSSLIDYLGNQNIRLDQPLPNYHRRDAENFLKGLDIEYEPPPNFGSTSKKYRVLAIGDPASTYRFRNDDGVELTIAAYFQSKGFKLRYPELNCLKVGSTVRSIGLPMELCSIPEGQVLNRKDEKTQVEKMCRFAATSTNRRKEKIMDILRYFNHNDSPIINAFGIKIGSQFIKVPMRNLPAPYMEYMNGQTITTNRGAWRMDRMQFLSTSKPPGGHKWGIIYEDNPRARFSFHDLNGIKNNIMRTSQQLNMNLEDKAEIIKYKNVNATLRDLAKEKYALVFVVLGNTGTSYAKVKQNAELEVGILTQCIKEGTIGKITRGDLTVISNILLKVNGKLNGTNHKIANDRDVQLMQLMGPIKNVMYLGADVTHPSPDQRDIPSVVGVAASHDKFGACYNMQYRLQRSTKEEIEDMDSIVTRHLQVYYKYQKSYPDQIIYYRDGVSDGQFPKIKSLELRAIKVACAKLKCNPKLTCIIVVKRHHTRFFPMKQPRDDRDFNNVDPGTVVDQHITHPNEIQFFMVSHQSIQGTAKPTRYNVIVDESKLDINLLQKLTYNLCHLFPRCNRVVSYPAPAYLAHLVAFRGRVYLEGSNNFSNNLKTEYERRLIKPHFMESNPMYFI